MTAQQLALRYDQYAAVLRDRAGPGGGRADLVAVRAFMAWIEGWWWDDAPPEPAAAPAAVSGGGRWGPVRWHDAGTLVLGYAAGAAGCYRVPVGATAPALGDRPPPA